MKNPGIINRLKLFSLPFIACLMPLKIYSQQAGTLDSTFGNSGMQYCETNFDQNHNPVSIMDPQNRILSLANTFNDSGFVLVRHFLDGSVDSTFGINGQLIFNSGTGFISTSLILQQDEKVLIGGSIHNDFFVARLSSDGIMDTTFGNQGQFIMDLGNSEYVVSLAQQADNKILFSGITASLPPANQDIALFRLIPGGIPDTSFGSGGMVITDVAPPGLSGDRSGPIVVQPDGKILMLNKIGGYWFGQDQISLIRYESDGMLDTTFANQGVYVDSMSLFGATCMALNDDHSIIVAGKNVYDFGGWFYTIKVEKYLFNGVIDSSFATDGTYESPWVLSVISLSSIVIQSDHKIVAGGSWQDSLLLMRFTMQGIPDTTFGSQGMTVNQFDGFYNYGQKVYLYPNDKITMLSNANNQIDTNKVMVVRYNNDISNGTFSGFNAERPDVLIYPNPAKGRLNIAFVNDNSKANLTISDITGKMIRIVPIPIVPIAIGIGTIGTGNKTTSLNTQNIEINTSDFAEGVYLVKIQTEKFSSTKKIIVVK